ncbi:hypothetical protein E6R60_25970 [Streptomyces sp. A0642]|uniref:hypothetical protein n=1 Tax=Streptomyces sp. A0642 TaxID=2563100 RepID=UPI0010A27F27|nr:hypothetical protein [Streptomyces sp. A0642]THA73102.1 hypothetical protein E6R60_25970 [Streptomyces sp. A0642]
MARGIRNTIGLILAVVGAAAAVWAPFRNWYNGRLGHDFRFWELFTGAGVTNSGAGLFASMFLPLLVAAVVALVGVVLRSRLLVLLAGVIAFGFAVLWMIRQGLAQGSLTVAGDGRGLGSGVGLALLGGLLMLIASAVMGGRPSRVEREERRAREREREAVYEDRERRGAAPDAPYGMAARGERDPDTAGRQDAAEPRRAPAPDAGSGRAPEDTAPTRSMRRPQQQPAPRGRPVPARDAGSDDAGRGKRDRTQYEEGEQSGGSQSSDGGHGSGRWHLHRGDRS